MPEEVKPDHDLVLHWQHFPTPLTRFEDRGILEQFCQMINTSTTSTVLVEKLLFIQPWYIAFAVQITLKNVFVIFANGA
jgi:hypothetical protein